MHSSRQWTVDVRAETRASIDWLAETEDTSLSGLTGEWVEDYILGDPQRPPKVPEIIHTVVWVDQEVRRQFEQFEERTNFSYSSLSRLALNMVDLQVLREAQVVAARDNTVPMSVGLTADELSELDRERQVFGLSRQAALSAVVTKFAGDMSVDDFPQRPTDKFQNNVGVAGSELVVDEVEKRSREWQLTPTEIVRHAIELRTADTEIDILSKVVLATRLVGITAVGNDAVIDGLRRYAADTKSTLSQVARAAMSMEPAEVDETLRTVTNLRPSGHESEARVHISPRDRANLYVAADTGRFANPTQALIGSLAAYLVTKKVLDVTPGGNLVATRMVVNTPVVQSTQSVRVSGNDLVVQSLREFLATNDVNSVQFVDSAIEVLTARPDTIEVPFVLASGDSKSITFSATADQTARLQEVSTRFGNMSASRVLLFGGALVLDRQGVVAIEDATARAASRTRQRAVPAEGGRLQIVGPRSVVSQLQERADNHGGLKEFMATAVERYDAASRQPGHPESLFIRDVPRSEPLARTMTLASKETLELVNEIANRQGGRGAERVVMAAAAFHLGIEPELYSAEQIVVGRSNDISLN